MISHSLGAMPRRTRDRLKQYADEWDTRGIRAWEEGWWQMPVTIGNLVGRINKIVLADGTLMRDSQTGADNGGRADDSVR